MKLPVVMAWVVERVPAHQLVVQERQVPIPVEVAAVEPRGLYPARPRSNVHCAKNGSRIHILSNAPPSLITSSASPALGIVSRGRGLDQRFIVQVERSALWQTQMFLGHLCKVKLQPFWAKNLK